MSPRVLRDIDQRGCYPGHTRLRLAAIFTPRRGVLLRRVPGEADALTLEIHVPVSTARSATPLRSPTEALTRARITCCHSHSHWRRPSPTQQRGIATN